MRELIQRTVVFLYMFLESCFSGKSVAQTGYED